MKIGYLYLALTVVFDAIGIGLLNKAGKSSQLAPLLLGLLSVNLGLILLSLAFKTIEMTIANAIFAGLATLSVALIGGFYFGERYTLFQYFCMGTILFGVVGLNSTGVGK
jgi:small multidrug resistance pump